jgi:hypothetical protein
MYSMTFVRSITIIFSFMASVVIAIWVAVGLSNIVVGVFQIIQGVQPETAACICFAEFLSRKEDKWPRARRSCL